MTKVAPAGPAVSLVHTRFEVRWTRFSVVVSLAMALNIVSMVCSFHSILPTPSVWPMKAYLTEQLPWRGDNTPYPVYDSYAAFSASYLAENQARFNRSTLLHQRSYYVDDATRTDVIRVALDMRRRTHDDCIDFLLGLPGLIFYGGNMRRFLCDFAASPRGLNGTDDQRWHQRGVCQYGLFAGTTVGKQCIWLTTGDDLTQDDAPGVFTLTFIFQLPRFYVWLWVKFGYRCLISLYVCFEMWREYYRHCTHLCAIVQRFGHTVPTPTSLAWQYDLVMGDPTALILLDPVVSAAFTLDVWLSMEYMGIAMVRATQIADLYTLFLAFMYFSRTVWFAYLALSVSSKVLKRFAKEHVFAGVDPTVVAICVAVYVVPVDYLQANTRIVNAYYWLFRVPASRDTQDEQVDVLLGCVLLTISIALFPVLYGVARSRCRSTPALSSRRAAYSSQAYNGVKARLVLFVLRRFRRRDRQALAFGGTLYAVFEANPRYKRYPTISLRSVDCFLVCKSHGVPKQMIRLSLLRSLDCHPTNPHLTITDGSTESVVNVLDRIECTGTSFCIHRGIARTAWCM
ncbi:hypothetical protein SDRG_03855 [Saprolegnia diclina VS20]|uniref:Uncharacterized protein n=1 Tax=Saprolegnia diclina (strain VS20) TaxID=1156394 RepID=T0S7Y0_SAPDV|nr:hypothetical protein SDRG_03855 [Saprolegnia diclina VS20]EQC38897.1 hypothetical protein SDRG_03855 [Saprolegnia diclina VS20]|eukprot:XP_008607721.1 hypothetical protein SDRG_03855 [Saprolegnia diclina VS20]